jgi:rare lipoprotein A
MDRPIAIRRPYALAVLALLCGLLALPAAALASSGGGALGGGGSSSGSSGSSSGSPGSTQTGTGTTPTTVTPTSGNITVSTTGSGMTLQAKASTMLWKGVSFSGSAPSAAGKTIEIERSGHQTGWTWAPTTHATVASDGSFTAVWPANHIGRFAIRAVITSADAQTATTTPTMTITVYRSSVATLYGPGFYGHRTACGQKLTPGMIGVASRTLKCGTKVSIYWGGKTLVVPVIDRGPYANHADWDLTEATGRAMGMDGTETIGAVSLPTQ